MSERLEQWQERRDAGRLAKAKQMNGYSLLVLPPPVIGKLQPSSRRFIEGINLPSRSRQGQRLAPKFQALQQQVVSLAASAGGAAPEEVIVLETIGSVSDQAGIPELKNARAASRCNTTSQRSLVQFFSHR